MAIAPEVFMQARDAQAGAERVKDALAAAAQLSAARVS